MNNRSIQDHTGKNYIIYSLNNISLAAGSRASQYCSMAIIMVHFENTSLAEPGLR
jgi:hypothetical protein